MATKKQPHTGFRNGDLFCFNCGKSYKMNLPQPISMAAAMMKQFDKDHKSCAKTWVEPVPEPDGKTEEENALWWIQNGEHGMSSKTIFNLLGALRISNESMCAPADPDDFRRCYLLIKAVPQFKPKLHLLKSLGEPWPAIVDNWDKLSAMLEEQMQTGKNNGMYDFMKSIGC